MLEEIRILLNDSIYPADSGGSVRVINLAKACKNIFKKTTIYSIDNNYVYSGTVKDIDVIQEIKSRNQIQKFIYYYNMLLSKSPIINNYDRAFENINKQTLFQIEGPSNYPLMKKMGVDRYILDEQNIYWELHDFPDIDIKNKIYNKLTSKREKRNEIEAIKHASHIFVCSKRDQILMNENIPDVSDNISVIPNCIDFKSFESYLMVNDIKKQKSKEINVLFVGTYVYSPNVEAVNSICNIIAPKFGNNVKFFIVGKNPPKIKKPDNVIFTGYVEDLKKCIMASDICIAPLKYGSGTRLKVLEYMAIGKPVISTSKGAEGLDYVNGKDIIIEDEIEKFVDRISELIEDEKLKKAIGSGALELIRKKYDWKIYKDTLRNIYEKVVEENN